MEKKQVDTGNAKVVPRGDYTQTLEEIAAGGFCPFCEEHFFKHHRKPLLHRSTHWFVTENSWPYEGTRFHFLLITREHVEGIEKMSVAILLDLQNVYRQLVDEFSLHGATLMIRSGDTKITGASVNHLHAHLIVGAPRTEHSKPIKALVGFEK
ncbi:MAG: HIT domain-containing protein [bacterium]